MSTADLACELNDNPQKSGSKRPAQVKLRQTCDACQAIKTRCSRDQPACQRCRNQNIQCHYSVSRRIGRPRRQVSPQTTASTPRVTHPDGELSVTSTSRNEISSISQPSNGVFTLDWNIVDVGVDRDRMVTETSESLQTRSSDALTKEQRSENNSSMAPRNGQASVGNAEGATRTSGIDGQDRYMESILGLSGSSRPSSMSSETDATSSHVSQPSTLESIYNFRPQLEHNVFDIAASENEFDPNGPFNWDILTAPVSPTRDDVCQCLESALSVTISIERQGHGFEYPGAMDLALGVEEQLREAVPTAVQCSVCKPRQADVLNMFSNAMAHVVDLFQHLCEVELFDNKGSPDTQTDNSPVLERFNWPPPKTSERISSTNSQHIIPYDRNMFTSVSHSPKHSTASAQHRESNKLHSRHKLEGLRVLVGRHLIAGDDRKCLLKHLLRRRLGALSSVLESLIRATQDLRMGLKRTDFINSCVDRGPNRFAEIDTRKPVKTASKLYDIIDDLEKMQI